MDKLKNHASDRTLERASVSTGREMQTQLGVESALKYRREFPNAALSSVEIDEMVVSYIRGAQDGMHGGATKVGAITGLAKLGVTTDAVRLSIVRLYSSGIIGQLCDDHLSWRHTDAVIKA